MLFVFTLALYSIRTLTSNYFRFHHPSADTSLTSTTTWTQNRLSGCLIVTFALMERKVYHSPFPLVVQVLVDRRAREMSNIAHPVLKGWHLWQESNSVDGR